MTYTKTTTTETHIRMQCDQCGKMLAPHQTDDHELSHHTPLPTIDRFVYVTDADRVPVTDRVVIDGRLESIEWRGDGWYGLYSWEDYCRGQPYERSEYRTIDQLIDKHISQIRELAGELRAMRAVRRTKP